jgi:transcriptional regulator with XRE-family HTH domain
MNDIRQYFADNLIFFRKNANMTQLDLAEQIHYSDKAISKWERGESLPDVNTLKAIADLFGISIDALISERKIDTPLPVVPHQINAITKKRWIISLLSASLVWMIATTVYSFASMIVPLMSSPWQVFIIAIPVSLLVVFVLSCIWFDRKVIFFCASLVLWTSALTLFVMLDIMNNWMFFIIPIPIEIIFVLWYTLRHIKEPKK